MIIDLTIVIPYYNESKTIIKTLDMIASQSYSPKEVILVNSSSTDNTSKVIDEWIKEAEEKGTKVIFRHRNPVMDAQLEAQQIEDRDAELAKLRRNIGESILDSKSIKSTEGQ